MLLLCFSHAFAGGGGEETSMLPLLWGLLLLSFAYLSAHFVVERLQRHYLFSSGAEYIALGIGLSYIAVFKDDKTYLPAITFAIGWIGLIYGLNLDFRTIFLRAGAALRMALTEVVVIGIGITVLGTVFFREFTDSDDFTGICCGAMLGCVALATSTSAVQTVEKRFPSLQTHVLSLLRKGATLNNIFAIVFFSIVVCTYQRENINPDFYAITPFLGGSMLALFTFMGGALLALLYVAFLLSDNSENSRFLALTGIICFAAGSAFFVDLPVLAVTLALGVVLANTRHRDAIHNMTLGAKKPAILLLLIFSGVQVDTVSWLKGGALCLGFWGIRFVLKAFSSWLSSYGSSMRSDLFRGHLSQGEVSLAIALAFKLMLDGNGEAVDLAYVAALFSVALNELISPRWLRSLLVDIGDIREDLVNAKEG
ncbi:MAG: cation:proton antiporter [Myxococcota bacterium]|nr:cation:proton antiporter [Myxococcota bacterium]